MRHHESSRIGPQSRPGLGTAPSTLLAKGPARVGLPINDLAVEERVPDGPCWGRDAHLRPFHLTFDLSNSGSDNETSGSCALFRRFEVLESLPEARDASPLATSWMEVERFVAFDISEAGPLSSVP